MKGKDGTGFLYDRADSRIPGRAEPLLLSCTNHNKGFSSEVKIQLKQERPNSVCVFPLF